MGTRTHSRGEKLQGACSRHQIVCEELVVALV